MSIFKDYKLTDDQQRRARRILRRFASRDYFGDVTPLLIRIVAENSDRINLLEEADKMLQWSLEHKKKPSVLRFNNWVRRSQTWNSNAHNDLSREMKKVESFKRKYGDSKKTSVDLFEER